LFLSVWLWAAGCASRPVPPSTSWPRYVLRAEQVVQLNPPQGERFDASGLLLLPDGELLTLNDRGPTLYRIEFLDGTNAADLLPLTDCFAPQQLAPLRPERADPFDCEGIARDTQGRLYLCEEFNRWVLRCDPKLARVERLPIDWSPVQGSFSHVDRNASFEGIAVGGKRLYLANERTSPVIIEVDLGSLRVTDHFAVYPARTSLLGTHYSDLAWHDGRLYVLCRQHRVVLEVDPRNHCVLAEFDYRALEDQLDYLKQFPAGVMEGLAVNRNFIWLVTDNNGFGRTRFPKDLRPTLLKCPRPDRAR
jgi:hypothetical protein